MKRLAIWVGLLAGGLLAGCRQANRLPSSVSEIRDKNVTSSGAIEKVTRTDSDWQKLLTPEQYRVTRQHGTERAFTGQLWNNHEPGGYLCVACDLDLFSSETKFESGTGWPSFYAPIASNHVGTSADNSLFMHRTEVHCARCDSHLGHVFEDGPKPTGLRYCINSVALRFKEK